MVENIIIAFQSRAAALSWEAWTAANPAMAAELAIIEKMIEDDPRFQDE